MIDGLLTTKITENLKHKLLNGKIQKIYQINDNEILLKIRANQTNYQVLNSIQSNSFRLHISNHQYSTLEVATNFTMLLRKQLEGGFIKNIFQHECERIIIFEITKYNELRDEQTKYLIFELIGRHSNTILCDQDFTIIQTLKFVPLSYGLTRIIQRGSKYEFISSNDRKNPLENIAVSDDYTSEYQGFSKLLSDEFIIRNNPKQTLNEYLTSKKVYVYKKIISYIKLEHLKEDYFEYDSIDQAFDSIYSQKSDSESVNNIFKKEIKSIKGNIKRNNNKITKLEKQYQDNQDYQKYQKYGTLLYDNIYLFNKEAHYDEVNVFDYDENKEITIKLNNQHSYTKNAQDYLKKYNKIKKSFSYLEQQIKLAYEQNEIYQDALSTFEYVKVNDVKEILDSLKDKKLLKGHSSTKKKKNYKPKYETFISSDDQTIYVGKNSIQNDYITFTLASKNDTWLHIKNQAGAHVIIKNEEPTNTTLEEAAKLAIFYSKTQPNTSYEVDYTLVKNLRKIKGSKLGQLSFNTNQSINIVNDIEITNKLKRGN
ncbi:putative ribosome quality control (RQC) complex YloA/Tae2 family protein [Bacilli bacterium PM5-3]|nr:putative ribosome quality control (RQC) complex YloA/Tae2 family protein [Bacilli bacterium PM5-3]MDH6603893.1 putative ribosome quality control (RQC) complex YloA/Tae2 family protein [Bacilli bacterium PM5-9]